MLRSVISPERTEVSEQIAAPINQMINNTISEATAVPEVNADRSGESFSIYPNPSDGQVQLYSKAAGMEGAQIKVSDVFGKIVFEKTIKSKHDTPVTFDMASNPEGVYLVQIRKDNFYSAQRMVLVR